MRNRFSFSSEIWLYSGMAGNWHFISLPKKDAARIKRNFATRVRGWGSLRVQAKVGKTAWKTSIFPDKEQGTYVLPVKADVRKREGIYAHEKISLSLEILI